MDQVPRRTQTRAKKAVEKIRKMQAEWKSWKGEDCTRVRVNSKDYLALTECNYIKDGKLSGTTLEVLPG